MAIKSMLAISGVVLLDSLFTFFGLSASVPEPSISTPDNLKVDTAVTVELPEPFQVAPEMELPEPTQFVDYRRFEATAYCDYGITFSGVLVQRGIVAADPRILPIGSVIEVKAGEYSGIYTVMDTGGRVKGRIIDIYMPEYDEAIQFGRQPVALKVLRYGWQPEPAEGISYTETG
jgi:3D (Asp-Asp-Asp) domain-containing protein